MKRERPIIFSGPMVRAILSGQKTQTRRVVKGAPPEAGCVVVNMTHQRPDRLEALFFAGTGVKSEGLASIRCPYGVVGGRLWVRESFAYLGNEDGLPANAQGQAVSEREAACIYRADCTPAPYGLWQLPDGSEFEGPWRPSIHMPRHAARLLLEVTEIRAERLHDITEADAQAEGVGSVAQFGVLWADIHGAQAWEANPWVWVVGFQQVRP